jgi:hypothetical protein
VTYICNICYSWRMLCFDSQTYCLWSAMIYLVLSVVAAAAYCMQHM